MSEGVRISHPEHLSDNDMYLDADRIQQSLVDTSHTRYLSDGQILHESSDRFRRELQHELPIRFVLMSQSHYE